MFRRTTCCLLVLSVTAIAATAVPSARSSAQAPVPSTATPSTQAQAPGQRPDQPTPGEPTQGQPTQGQPTQGQPTQGQPTQGQPTQGQPTSGQPAPGPPSPSKPAVPGNISPAEFNRLFEAYALLQAQNMLRLSDEQYAEFIVRLKALQNARRQHQHQRSRLVQELRKLAVAPNATGDEGSIRGVLDSIVQEDERAHEEIKTATAQVDELLDVQQRARFRVFEDQLERWKLDLLSRVRRPARARPPGTGAPGSTKPPPSASPSFRP